MSYILEALKKAEQQRELGQVPGIDSDHDAHPAPGSRRWLWIALLAVNVVIVLLLALLWMRTDSAVVRPGDTASMGGSSPVVPSPAEPRVSGIRPALAPVAVERVLAPVVPGGYAQTDAEEDEPWATQQRVDTLDAPPVPDVELPVWPQVPDYLLDQLANGLRLDVHVYSAQPENRFVLINLAKYHEGDTLRDGPVLQEITPRGAILSLRGQRFHLPAQ